MKKIIPFLLISFVLFTFSCNHKNTIEQEDVGKNVEVLSLSICDVDIDILKKEWSCNIDGDIEKVKKGDISIIFKGELEDVQNLLKTLQVKEIASIAEKETKNLELSTTKTNVFKAWKKIVKVTREKLEYKDKDVKVKSLTICGVEADIENWNCLIKNGSVKKENIKIEFEGEKKNIERLIRNLQVQEISSINEGNIENLVLSTTKTPTYKAWSKTIKVRRAWSNMDKNEIRFKKFTILEKNYGDYINTELEKNRIQLLVNLNIDISVLINKVFTKSSLKYDFYSSITNSVFVPSPKIDLQYADGETLRDVTDDEAFDLAMLVNENQDVVFHFSISPKGQGNSWRMLNIKIRFCIKSDKADIESIKVPKSSLLYNSEAELKNEIELNNFAGNLQIVKDLEHDGTINKPILLKGKFKSDIKIEKITNVFFKASPKAKVKYGKDKLNLKDGEFLLESYSLEFDSHPIFIQIIAENEVLSNYYELTFVYNF